MKKTKLLVLLTAILAMTISLLAPYSAKTEAAAKPSVKKKNVTLSLDTKSYEIQFKNLSSKATVKYSSSDKKVVKIKKSKVVPVDVGEAVVTAKISQNGNSYKLKVNFAVVEAAPKKKNMKSITSARIKELKKNAEDYSFADYPMNDKILSSEDEVTKSIIDLYRNRSTFHLVISKLNLLKSEEEYRQIFSGLTELEFSKVTIYRNAVYVAAKGAKVRHVFDDEYDIDYALSSGIITYLTQSERTLYNRVVSLGKQLKGKDDYETVKNIHDYLVLNIAYPSSYSGDGVHSLDFALNYGYCVCDGYAKAFYFLCKANGIDCIIVSGDATNSSGRTESHAWNKVKINKKWYSIDVTWDDPTPDTPNQVKYFYFLITDSDISKNHVWDDTNLPKARFTDLKFFYKEYESLKKVNGVTEAVEYVNNAVSKKYDTHFECNLQFIESSGNTSIYNSLYDLMKKYNSSWGCGYSIRYEGAGLLGNLYTVKVYR